MDRPVVKAVRRVSSTVRRPSRVLKDGAKGFGAVRKSLFPQFRAMIVSGAVCPDPCFCPPIGHVAGTVILLDRRAPTSEGM